MILYLTSNDSNVCFSDNKPWRFKIHLNSPLVFHGKWEVALLEFVAHGSKATNKNLDIFCNICEESIVKGEKRHILRRITFDCNRQWNACFYTPIYLNLILKEMCEFEIYIKDLNDRDATFLKEPVLLTLHFKKSIMNSALYVPDPRNWVKYFAKADSDTLKTVDVLKTDNTCMQLTSPVQSVVERAKSEIQRINTDHQPTNSIISTSAKHGIGSTCAKTRKRIHKQQQNNGNRKQNKRKKIVRKVPQNSKKTNKKKKTQKTSSKKQNQFKDIFG